MTQYLKYYIIIITSIIFPLYNDVTNAQNYQSIKLLGKDFVDENSFPKNEYLYNPQYDDFLLFGQTFPTLEYKRSVFISIDYNFNNEFLYKPYQVREIPTTKEKVILDIGNLCIYIFSNEGKYIRRISRPGQGPGELGYPTYFDIDEQGDIYVYDSGNSRISIFSKNGKLYTSFRIEESPFSLIIPTLFVTKDREIIINNPYSGYFITVYSREGKVIKEIGSVPNFDSPLYLSSATGYPFKNENGNYYIFLESYLLVKVFNDSGKVVLEKSMIDIIPRLSKTNDISEIKIGSFRHIFNDIMYRNKRFYIIDTEERKKLAIYILNNNLEIEKKIILPLENEIGIKIENKKISLRENSGLLSYNFKYTCEILLNDNILFPSYDESQVYIFKK